MNYGFRRRWFPFLMATYAFDRLAEGDVRALRALVRAARRPELASQRAEYYSVWSKLRAGQARTGSRSGVDEQGAQMINQAIERLEELDQDVLAA